MSILISGSLLSEENQLRLVTKKTLLKGYGSELFKSIKYHIIVGETDFMVPHEADMVKCNLDALSYRPFPVLCVMGNHTKNYDTSDMKEIDMGIGDTVYQIKDKPFVAYLKRGKVYNFDGYKCLVLGGAPSFRLSNQNPFIMWTEQEKSDLFHLLETDTAFDFVFSQVGPYQVNRRVYDLSKPDSERDEVFFFNDTINDKIQFSKWICSHYFSDGFYCDEDTSRKNKKFYQYLYETTRIIDRKNGRAVYHRENEEVTT